jgi:hypothetical protein
MKTHYSIRYLVVLFAVLAVVGLSAHALEPNIYFGNLHSHTKYSDGKGTPQDAFYWARYGAQVDFYAVTDHAEQVDPYEWWKTGQYANAANQDGEFVAIRGFEWSHPWWGHITVWNTSSYTNAVIDYTMADFYKWLDRNNGIAQFNHPGREYGVFEYFLPTPACWITWSASKPPTGTPAITLILRRTSSGTDSPWTRDGK